METSSKKKINNIDQLLDVLSEERTIAADNAREFILSCSRNKLANNLPDVFWGLAHSGDGKHNFILNYVVTKFSLPEDAVVSAGNAYIFKGEFSNAAYFFKRAGSDYAEHYDRAEKLMLSSKISSSYK